MILLDTFKPLLYHTVMFPFVQSTLATQSSCLEVVNYFIFQLTVGEVPKNEFQENTFYIGR